MDFPDFNNPYLKNLLDSFNKFAAAHKSDDVVGRVTRSIFSGGKAAVDKSLEEFPKTFLTKTAKDFYALVTSQETADNISAAVSSFDAAKIQDVVDNLTTQLTDRETALKVAAQVKDLLSKTSTDDLESALDQLMGSRPLSERMMFLAVFSQVKPVIDQMRTASVDEVADIIIQLAGNLPSDLIAAQLSQYTSEITPERISKHTHDAVGKLPSPGAISDIVHGVGKSASESLDSAAKSASPADAADVLKQFTANIGTLIAETIAKDNAAKKTFKKKGGDFKL